MFARELAIVLRARVTWLQAALSALLVGHGFVLAIDVYSAGSRSAATQRLMAREFDPLLGIVRPTLGGLYLALSLLGPLVAARALAVEKERRTFGALLLQTGAPLRLVLTKTGAALAGAALQLVAPMLLLVAWWTVGGHLGAVETAVAFVAYLLYLALVTSIGMAAAAWTETFAQAATVAILVVTASWAIDASEGFAALAWLGRALDWSVTTHLTPMERGTLLLGACLWMASVTAGALALAWVGVRIDLDRPRRIAALVLVLLVTGTASALAHRGRRGFDLTEDRTHLIEEGRMDLRELRAAMEGHGAAWSGLLDQNLDPDATVHEVDEDDGYERDATIGIRLAQALHHGTDHRSQICTALTALGVEPPGIDVWNFGLQAGRVVEVLPKS